MSRKSGSKQALFEQLALIASAFSSPARLEILDFLAQGERSVDSLASVAGLSVANTSKHLQQLRHAGLVDARKEGLHVFYRMSGDDVLTVITDLRVLAQSRLAEVDLLIENYLSSKDELEPIQTNELMERANEGLVTILDVRPEEEFSQGHLTGAINIPLNELEEHLAELPRETEVIAYCRGPWCVLSYEAVSMLRSKGIRARRLDGGLPEWRQEGRPVTRST
jgi:rhodanese-related sulfurtransferase/predicted transcriptional regulator